jgi:hypothetical protein
MSLSNEGLDQDCYGLCWFVEHRERRVKGLSHTSAAGCARALLTTSAMDASLIPCFLQYLDSNQLARFFVPLLALHEIQHLAMFSLLTIRASLTMCSQDGLDFLVSLVDVNWTPQ